MALRVLHLSTYAGGGGAGRAAAALNQALQKAGVDSRLVSAHGTRFKAARAADRALWRLQRSQTKTWRSPARFGSLSASEINASSADVVNLHWVTDGFMSIEEIGKIKKPLVMSMYDMWPFCGTEHYGVDFPDARWRTGYTHASRPEDESGWDLDRDAWERKTRDWSPFHLVPASTWLTESVQRSALMADWLHTRIPHPVDADVFKPMDKSVARGRLGIASDFPTIAFLASAGIGDRRKGFDLLAEAMGLVVAEFPDAQVLLVGPVPNASEIPRGLKVVALGEAHDDRTLSMVYSAADVLAIPSREDNMPLTAMEAQMCGRAVVGFRVGGLADIVEQGVTGYLADPLSVEDLGKGLVLGLQDARSDHDWGVGARNRAIDTWGFEVVARAYSTLHDKVISTESPRT